MTTLTQYRDEAFVDDAHVRAQRQHWRAYWRMADQVATWADEVRAWPECPEKALLLAQLEDARATFSTLENRLFLGLFGGDPDSEFDPLVIPPQPR